MESRLFFGFFALVSVALLLSGCLNNSSSGEPRATPTLSASPTSGSEIITVTAEATGELKPTKIEGPGYDVKIKANVNVTTDCGTMDCFREKFAACEKATLTTNLAGSNAVIYYYEILGPKNGGCEIKSKYLANPNPAWIDKEMSCVYDNTKTFENAAAAALQEQGNCEGPLYDIMFSIPPH